MKTPVSALRSYFRDIASNKEIVKVNDARCCIVHFILCLTLCAERSSTHRRLTASACQAYVGQYQEFQYLWKVSHTNHQLF